MDSQKGHRITILSCEKAENFKKNKAVVSQKCKAANMEWNYIDYNNSIPVVSSFLTVRKLKAKALAIAKQNKIEVVHCRSIIPAMVGETVQKKEGVKFIFDIRGFWADERVDGKIWNLKNPLYRFLYNYFKKKEKYLFEHADCIVTLTENAKSYIQKEFVTKQKFLVVPCCVDFEHFNFKTIQNDKVNELRAKIGISKDNYVLTYVGSLGTRYMLREMLEFFKVLKVLQPNASFLFISKSDTSEIKPICTSIGLDDSSIFITSCEYTEIPTYISIGDASIFFIITSFSGKAVSPTKQAEVMSLGLPIVANSGLGDTDLILKETKSGVVLNQFTELEYQRLANEILNFNGDKEKIREAARQYFTLESGIEKYDSVYKNLEV
ncbi:MAG: glycosyltransferase involved in cell wall biosynthesis [Vicingaceae bacterium]